MTEHLNKDSNSYLTSALLITAVITTAAVLSPFLITSSIATSAAATMTTTTAGNNATTTSSTSPSSGLELSSQPIWDEHATTTGRTPINESHSIVSFIGNGTMTAPDTGKTINMTNNGSGLVSPVPGYTDTVSAYGREHVFSEDAGDTTAITFYEIIRYDPMTFEGKGLVIAVFDRNATGSLAPFNGMMVVGTHEEDPTTPATIRLWEWEGAIPMQSAANDMEESPAPPMNTTRATEREQQQQQQTNTTMPPTPLLE